MKTRTVAIYWDWQNVRADRAAIDCLLRFAHARGRVITPLVYAQWRIEKDCADAMLYQLGFRCVQVPPGRNNADLTLIADCEQQIEASIVQTVILISGDGDFAPLLRKLRLQAIRVILFSGMSCSKKLKKYADEHHHLNDFPQQAA